MQRRLLHQLEGRLVNAAVVKTHRLAQLLLLPGLNLLGRVGPSLSITGPPSASDLQPGPQTALLASPDPEIRNGVSLTAPPPPPPVLALLPSHQGPAPSPLLPHQAPHHLVSQAQRAPLCLLVLYPLPSPLPVPQPNCPVLFSTTPVIPIAQGNQTCLPKPAFAILAPWITLTAPTLPAQALLTSQEQVFRFL